VVVQKENLFLIKKTGGGKSAVFTITHLMTKKMTVVIVLLIAVIQDQANAIRALAWLMLSGCLVREQ